jgi:hypothetical protein
MVILAGEKVKAPAGPTVTIWVVAKEASGCARRKTANPIARRISRLESFGVFMAMRFFRLFVAVHSLQTKNSGRAAKKPDDNFGDGRCQR